MSHRPSRRAIFGAGAALTVASLPVATAAARPDAELLDLARRWESLEEERERLIDELQAIADAAAQSTPAPRALYHRPTDRLWFSMSANFDKPADGWAVEEWRKALNTHWLRAEAFQKAVHARATEIIEAHEAHQRVRESERRRLGYDAASARLDAVYAQTSEIEERSMQLRATTREGLAFKARLFQRYADLSDPEDLDAQLFASLAKDLMGDA